SRTAWRPATRESHRLRTPAARRAARHRPSGSATARRIRRAAPRATRDRPAGSRPPLRAVRPRPSGRRRRRKRAPMTARRARGCACRDALWRDVSSWCCAPGGGAVRRGRRFGDERGDQRFHALVGHHLILLQQADEIALLVLALAL